MIVHPLLSVDLNENELGRYPSLYVKMLSGFYSNIDLKLFKNDEVLDYFLHYIELIEQEEYKEIKPNLKSLEHFIQYSKGTLNLDWLVDLYMAYRKQQKESLVFTTNRFFSVLIANFFDKGQFQWAQETALALYASGEVPVKENNQDVDLEQISCVIRTILDLPWEKLASNPNAKKLFSNLSKVPCFVFKHAIKELDAIIDEAQEKEQQSMIDATTSCSSHQLVMLLTEFGLPCKAELQNNLLLEEISHEEESETWLETCEMLFEFPETHHDHLKATFRLQQYLLDVKNFPLDSNLEERMVKVIQLFCIADRRGLVLDRNWQLISDQLNSMESSLAHLFFMFAVSRPTSLSEAIWKYIDFTDGQRERIKNYLISLSGKGEQQRQWAIELLEELKKRLAELGVFNNLRLGEETNGEVLLNQIDESNGELVNWVLRLSEELKVYRRTIRIQPANIQDIPLLIGAPGGAPAPRILSRQELANREGNNQQLAIVNHDVQATRQALNDGIDIDFAAALQRYLNNMEAEPEPRGVAYSEDEIAIAMARSLEDVAIHDSDPALVEALARSSREDVKMEDVDAELALALALSMEE